MDKLKVGVLGATGIVGRRFIDILSSHPWFNIGGLYASEASEGASVETPTGERFFIKAAEVENICKEKFDLIFSAVSDQHAGKIENDLTLKGFKIFSNASANRLNPNVPLVVPEINMNHLGILGNREGYVVANGNCSTIGFVLALHPLMNLRISDTVLTTFQSVSGSGTPGTPFMEIHGNVIPNIRGEENKIEKESAKIFGKVKDDIIVPENFDVSATTTRVPVSVGHLLSISSRVEDEIDIDYVKDFFQKYGNGRIEGRYPSLPSRSVVYMDDEYSPQPSRDSESKNYVDEMQVKVGRLRLSGKRINFVALVNNLTRGAAGASLLNAEITLKEEGLI